MHRREDLGVAAPLVGEEAAVVEIAAAAIAAADDEMAAIVPGPVLVLGDGIDLKIQRLALMAAVAVALAAETEKEIEDSAPEHSRTGGEIEHEPGIVA